MIKPIEWHQENVANRTVHYNKLRARALEDLEIADRGIRDLQFYEYQIDEALKMGATGFDRDRFRVKRDGTKERK